MPSRGPTFPTIFALIAAGSLLVDYIMTVAVSTTSAVEQVISAAPGVDDWRVEIGVVAVLLIMVGNLRGLRESGNIFALPTYLFLVLSADHDRDRHREGARWRWRAAAQPNSRAAGHP